MNHHYDSSIYGSFMTSVITAVFALIPPEAFTYAEKLISVLVLAMAAEAGRRLVGAVWKNKDK
jgi:hypothetical protein